MKQGTLLACGAIATLAITCLAVVSPVIGVALLSVLVFVVWAIRKPHAAACTMAFLTAAFPKAGVKVADFPFPVFLLGLILAVLLMGVGQRKHQHSAPVTVVVGLYLLLVASRTLVFFTENLATAAAFAAWAAGPIVLLYIATRRTRADLSFRRAIERGFILAVAFGIVQLVGGIEATAIPGLTHALGDDITLKNNVINTGVGDEYSKIPSTYQNGNIFGLVAATFFAMALARLAARNASRNDYVLLVASVVAIALSGSRTAIIAAAFAFVVVLLRGGNVGKKIAALAMIVLIGVIVLQVQPGLAQRYSIADLTATGGAGRSDMWRSYSALMSPSDYIFGLPDFLIVEGWLGILMQIGVVGVGLLIAAVLLLSRGRRDLLLPLGVLLIGAVVDSSYRLFPTWFLLAAMAAAYPFPEKFTVSKQPLLSSKFPPFANNQMQTHFLKNIS